MPRSFHFDPQRDVLFVSAWGVFTDHEFTAGATATVTDPTFRADLRVLVDFLKVEELRVSAQTLAKFVEQRHFSARSRRAFLVNSHFAQAFVEIGKSFGAPEQIRVFTNRAQAVAWLNEGQPADKWLD